MANPCRRLQFRRHAQQDGTVVIGNGSGAGHAKYFSADDALAIVGSANMDTQSWNHSREANVVVDDPVITRAWDEQVFFPVFSRGHVAERCWHRP